MQARNKRLHKVDVLKKVFASPFYIFLAIAAVVAYYWLFYYLITVSNKGLFFVTVPMYLIYALILSASVLVTLSVYAVSNSLKTKYSGAEGGLLSVATSAFGGFIVGCNCYAPIFSSVLYAIGFGTLQVSSAISFLGAYQLWFVVLLIAANLIFIYYQLGRITRIGGPHRR
ncbi:MAG: hypothetical protein KGH57_02220 [Candidatus Micrarchaeota archaeon]|nr:hypothetical protein [Candidatus Micrarchaeota archaeon]